MASARDLASGGSVGGLPRHSVAGGPSSLGTSVLEKQKPKVPKGNATPVSVTGIPECFGTQEVTQKRETTEGRHVEYV